MSDSVEEPTGVAPAGMGEEPGETLRVRSPQLYALFEQYRGKSVPQPADADAESGDEPNDQRVWFEVIGPKPMSSDELPSSAKSEELADGGRTP